MPRKTTKTKAAEDRVLACSLQGGGALGSYQVGIIKALHEANYDPEWFIGTSIGAINAAIAAGNAPKDRIEKLEAFWNDITNPDLMDPSLIAGDIHSRRLRHQLSAHMTLLFGQPNFFRPRFPSPHLGWHDDPGSLSYYDTSILKDTLERYVDFDRINDGKSRLCLGAVEVISGEMVYFDSHKHPLKAEHVMASGALPPGFPAIEIEGKYYWDGGISSNSPIGYVLQDPLHKNLLCFMVHLFDSYGLEPRSIDEVNKRKKDIEFSSRFGRFIHLYKEIHALKYTIHEMAKGMPEHVRKQAQFQNLINRGWDRKVCLVRFLYEQHESDLASKDYEFSRHSMHEHIAKGYSDGKQAIKSSPWNQPIDETTGIALHDMSSVKHLETKQS